MWSSRPATAPMKALIPAAGRGLRAWPKAGLVPKVLLEIDGKPILQRNIEILRDCLGIRDITIIVGYLHEQIRGLFGDGGGLGVSIRYVDCTNPDIGLARGMLLTRDQFHEPFVPFSATSCTSLPITAACWTTCRPISTPSAVCSAP